MLLEPIKLGFSRRCSRGEVMNGRLVSVRGKSGNATRETGYITDGVEKEIAYY